MKEMNKELFNAAAKSKSILCFDIKIKGQR